MRRLRHALTGNASACRVCWLRSIARSISIQSTLNADISPEIGPNVEICPISSATFTCRAVGHQTCHRDFRALANRRTLWSTWINRAQTILFRWVLLRRRDEDNTLWSPFGRIKGDSGSDMGEQIFWGWSGEFLGLYKQLSSKWIFIVRSIGNLSGQSRNLFVHVQLWGFRWISTTRYEEITRALSVNAYRAALKHSASACGDITSVWTSAFE